jgi:hypothetical protein
VARLLRAHVGGGERGAVPRLRGRRGHLKDAGSSLRSLLTALSPLRISACRCELQFVYDAVQVRTSAWPCCRPPTRVS